LVRCIVRKRIKPVPPGAIPLLRDRDASAPSWVPGDDEIGAATHALLARASTLQGMLYAEGKRALLFVLQGRDACGKDGLLRTVFTALHPQGVKVSSFGVPTPLEAAHDFLWRVHRELPAFGQVGVWNRSHYEDILVPRVHRTLPKKVWAPRYERINVFEAEAIASGVQIVKLFVHISRNEQAERFQARAADPARQWKLQASDFRDRAAWSRFSAAYRDVIERCNSRSAPWYVIPADRKTVRDYLTASLLVERLEAMHPVAPPADPALLKAARALT
jgi:PPK2 family polyphosphate:nucleotide phosphotransferase